MIVPWGQGIVLTCIPQNSFRPPAVILSVRPKFVYRQLTTKIFLGPTCKWSNFSIFFQTHPAPSLPLMGVIFRECSLPSFGGWPDGPVLRRPYRSISSLIQQQHVVLENWRMDTVIDELSSPCQHPLAPVIDKNELSLLFAHILLVERLPFLKLPCIQLHLQHLPYQYQIHRHIRWCTLPHSSPKKIHPHKNRLSLSHQGRCEACITKCAHVV